MDEDHELLMTFLPASWRILAVEHGALTGLRNSKSVGRLARTTFASRWMRTFLEEDHCVRQNSETLESLGSCVNAADSEVVRVASCTLRGAVSPTRDHIGLGWQRLGAGRWCCDREEGWENGMPLACPLQPRQTPKVRSEA